jgi:hypothetical protein
MKKVIELLEDALDVMLHVTQIPESYQEVAYIEEAIAELKALPRWETPEQYEKRTGEKWPDDWPVWSITTDGILEITTMGEEEIRKTWGNHFYAIPTEAGPPPEDWRPEEISE